MTSYVKTMREKIGHDMLILAGAGVLPYKDGRVLLQKRRDNGCWAINGGCMEVGETAEATAKRELFEETGLVAKTLELVGVFSGEDMLYTYPNGDKVCVVAIQYACRDFGGELSPQVEEVAELRWFEINNLPENINPPDIRPINAIVEYVSKHY